MKSTKRFVPATVLLCLLFVMGQTYAQNRNDLLILQSLEDPGNAALSQINLDIHEDWREAGVRKIRVQNEGDTPGTFHKLLEFDGEGNLVRKEKADGGTWSFEYDRQNRLKRITGYENDAPVTTQYFYYTRKGDLKKSVLKYENENKEIEGEYNEHGHLARVRHFTGGISTKTMTIKYGYDEDGRILSMQSPAGRASYLYNGDQLVQLRQELVGKSIQVNLGYDKDGFPVSLKTYEEKDGDLILMESAALEYNTAKLLARKTKKPRDPKAKAQVSNFFYDAFDEDAIAMRADWDGGGYGYGTPVIVKWANPELDTRVTDSLLPLRFTLHPGVGQEMPEIKDMTLRLNHKLTNREIGHVVLRKTGEGADYYVEEELPLMEGENAVTLEVETEMGKFTSGERYITYKNPKRQIKVADLHVLAIGVEDYGQEQLNLQHTIDDVKALMEALQQQEGRMFGKVRSKVLSDKDATKANIEEAVRTIRGKAAAQDLVLIYFAGHGEEYEGNFYLKPVDVKEGRENLSASAIDNRWVLEEISRYNAPTLYFLDAAHDVNTETADIGHANLDEVKDDFEDVITSDDDIRIFMSSTSAKQKSSVHGESQRSVFTEALIEGLAGKADEKGNNNGYVTIDELSEYVADRVLDMTSWKQKPSSVKRGIGLVPISRISEN